MNTIRKLAVALVLGLLLSSGSLEALSPPEMDCPSGCSCTENGSAVVVYCEELDPPEVCDEIWNACSDYCDAYEDFWKNEMGRPEADCYSLYLTENCQPMGLEAPTDTNCQCICWY